MRCEQPQKPEAHISNASNERHCAYRLGTTRGKARKCRCYVIAKDANPLYAVLTMSSLQYRALITAINHMMDSAEQHLVIEYYRLTLKKGNGHTPGLPETTNAQHYRSCKCKRRLLEASAHSEPQTSAALTYLAS